jgi:hypothetical protein
MSSCGSCKDRRCGGAYRLHLHEECRLVALVRTDVAEERIASIFTVECRLVALVRTDVAEERIASIFTVE